MGKEEGELDYQTRIVGGLTREEGEGVCTRELEVEEEEDGEGTLD